MRQIILQDSPKIFQGFHYSCKQSNLSQHCMKCLYEFAWYQRNLERSKMYDMKCFITVFCLLRYYMWFPLIKLGGGSKFYLNFEYQQKKKISQILKYSWNYFLCNRHSSNFSSFFSASSVVIIFWARVLCHLTVEEARFRMRIILGVVLIRSLACI